MASTIRFLRHYFRPPPAAVSADTLVYRRGGQALPMTTYRPAGRRGPRPAWIVLHGLTWHGRRHPSLDRFARALAAGGSVIYIPEIPEWRRLEVAPGVTAPSIAAALDAVHAHRAAIPDRIGVFGFSFGATHGLAALADPQLDERIRAVAAWGGYYDLHRLFRFGFTGEHELDGVRERVDPDPYGSWIMGANYLTGVPGHGGDRDVAAALRRLAEESGRRGIYAGDPAYDPLKAELRRKLPAAKRELFDLFAPPSGPRTADAEPARAFTRSLADAALRADPLLDPAARLPRLRARTIVAHGRDDRLVPYTESLRLTHALPPECGATCSITSLFAHSKGAARALHPLRLTREAIAFARLLHDILALV